MTITPERYIEDHLEEVRGMSGPFSLRIAVALMREQSRLGVTGGVAEIGVFEGRFLIGLALALEPGERAVAVDTFDWPDADVETRFERNVARFSIDHRIITRQGSSARMTRDDLSTGESGRPRLIHIDGDHAVTSLRRDLELALDTIERRGLIMIDDMLHPGYPDLSSAVHALLRVRDDWVITAIVDREDIVAATKYILSSRDMASAYRAILRRTFHENIWGMPARLEGYECPVLTVNPRLPIF